MNLMRIVYLMDGGIDGRIFIFGVGIAFVEDLLGFDRSLKPKLECNESEFLVASSNNLLPPIFLSIGYLNPSKGFLIEYGISYHYKFENAKST